MAKCEFSIEFIEEAPGLVVKAEEAITYAGGKFSGNTERGNFELTTAVGKVSGNYIIQEALIHIRIDKKPLLLSCSKIEEELRKHLAE